MGDLFAAVNSKPIEAQNEHIDAIEQHENDQEEEKQEEEEEDSRMHVRCPLCRKQTVRQTAIRVTSSLENAECCCCLDSPSTMVLACGHLCVCEICFQKLD